MSDGIQPDPIYNQLGQQGNQHSSDLFEDLAFAGLVLWVVHRFGNNTLFCIASYAGLFYICGWHWQVPMITLGAAVVAYVLYRAARRA